jgi:hypothetical protein
MFDIEFIKEKWYILNFLLKRNLLEQYKKSKKNILLWNYTWNKIWFKQPRKDQIVYFRINKQYRALWRFEWKVLIIFDIDNHQN